MAAEPRVITPDQRALSMRSGFVHIDLIANDLHNALGQGHLKSFLDQ